MFLSIYVRWEMVDYQVIPTLREAIAYLDRMDDEEDTYSVCVYNQTTGEIAYRNNWPDGCVMTDEQLKPYVEYVKTLTIRQLDIRQKIKASSEDTSKSAGMGINLE